MDNLFVYGQIKDKLQIHCKTMSILTIVLSLIFVVVGWIPINVARMNGYLEERSIYDVQIFSRYNVVDKIEDLNNIELNTEEIRKYLTMKGCEITGEAKVSCYYPQIEDFYKNANKDKPNLIIPVSEYNQLLRMNKTEEINLQDNEYAIAWAPSVLEEEIRESSKSDSTLTVGEEELYKKSDYQYNVGMGIFTSGLEASYIVPDHICNKLTRATVYYAANTKEKIPVNLAKEIEKEVIQTLNVKNSYNVDLYYVRLQALQINEGISNSLMLRLGATYIGLLLLLLSLAILSLQQLTDSLEHSWRFIVISKIGVSVEKIVHYIRQQMYVWFGVPFVIACFAGNMINIYMVWSDYEEYFPYISIGESIVTGLLGNVIVAIFFLLYLLMTYLIGQKVEQAEFVQADVVMKDHKVSVQGVLLDQTKGVADVAFQEQDGIVTVSLRETRKSSFHTNEFQAEYESSGEVKRVVLENRILWDDGILIDGTVSDLYQSRNPYVGDISADGRSVQAARAVLGINDEALLCYGTQLQTSEEPYGWTFLNVQISSSDNVERLQQEMKQLGCLLIAVTDNLGYVSFEYCVDGTENSDGSTTLTVTEADADALAGQSVKAMSQTPAGLQKLVELIK